MKTEKYIELPISILWQEFQNYCVFRKSLKKRGDFWCDLGGHKCGYKQCRVMRVFEKQGDIIEVKERLRQCTKLL